MVMRQLLLVLCLSTSGVAFTPGRVLLSRHVIHRNMANADETTEKPQSLPDEDSSDIMNSPAFLKRKLEILQADISKAEEDIENAKKELSKGKEEWGDKLDALNREYLTAQERAIKQNEESGEKATAEVAKKILEVLDNYDRAFSSVTPSSDSEKEVEAAYKATYESILATFNELGIKEVECVGKEFDYEVHNAVMMRPSDEYEEGFVIEELAKGYIMGEDLIRAAMVIVAA
mmetsp:Transcript_35152/g.43017  ORF Transcript_35152/g.43017 Transcript_35152/m.43017 type:complete len:232 (+) Transcript_35152:171-866(+)